MKTILLIHHSGDPSEAPQFEKINAYHRSKGFPRSSFGLYGGYNFLGEKDGQLKQYRGLDERGAHTDASCGEGHCNLVGMAYCFAGDMTWQVPNDDQLSTFYTVWKSLNYPKLVLHSDVKGTSCPGDYDYRNEMTRRWIADLKQQLKNAIAALPRWVGTLRGNMMKRKIERLKDIDGVE